MDSRKILKSINSKKFSTLLDDIQSLISSTKAKIDCSEVCNILRALYQSVVPSSTELETTDARKTIFEMIPCINLCIDYAKSSYSFSDLSEHQFFPVLYHLIRAFLKAELYQPALSIARIFQTFLEDSENNFDKGTYDKGTYVKNINITFWNDALHTEKHSNLTDHDTALLLRTISIEFLLLDKPSIQTISEKINLTIIRYCQNNSKIDIEKIGAFLKSMWIHLESFSKNYDHKAYLYKLLLTWFENLLKYVKDFSFLKYFLVWYQNLSEACDKKKTQKVLKICSSISSHIIKFFFLLEAESNFEQICLEYVEFCKSYKNWNDTEIQILANTCTMVYSSFARCFRSSKNSEDENVLGFMKSNINTLVLIMCHFFDMFSEELVQKHVSVPSYVKYSVCHIVTSLFLTLLKKEQDVAKKKDMINKAEKFVRLSFSKITPITEAENASKLLIGYASCLTRLAMAMYSWGLYSESLYFFEVGDAIFSMCSSFPDYNTEEAQVTLWKLHEVFIYASFLSSFHEKALKIIVKSLIIHPKKTKECFDLWRRVKRDVIRIENEYISSKTVSDFLLEMSTEVEAETEIIFLVEELKICKSERTNFETEMTAVSDKLLNMPCSNAVRAYLLQEILTMPLNLSEKISVQLGKTLPEICLEAISLFEDHLAKNSEDHAAKLYLSLAYFWLYHDKLSHIHGIAEKEAQNMLKPTSPPSCVAVHNDVEEENDTCDIQPVHPLVSVSIENETFKYLDLAVQLWDSISHDGWQEVSLISKETNILDIIIASAEIYSTALHDLKELKLWIILKSASSAVGSKFHEITGSISLINLLIRLGYLNMASYFLKTVEDQAECFKNNEFETLELKFQLSKSNYYFQIGKFDVGLKILQEILASPVLEKRFKSVKMIHAECMLLLSEYLWLSSKAFVDSDCKDYIENNSCLASLMESVSLSKALLKHLSEKQGSCVQGLEWVCFKPLLIKNFLKAHVKLGDCYFKVGDPRFARCYLQEALKIAESQILTYWSSKILIILGHIDLMCDNFKDCRVKANGVKYILEIEAKTNYFEVLNQMQAKYSTSKSDKSLSPTSPDELVISTVPSVLLPREIKHTFIDKIPVMSSPISKMPKNSQYNHVKDNFSDENFSKNLLLLESSFLFYLLSQTETDTKESTDALQELLNYYNSLKNLKHLSTILSSIKLTYEVNNPLFRLQSKLEILFYVSIQMQKLEFYCIKNDTVGAKDAINKSFGLLEKVSNCPSFSYPEIYALLKYHDIRVSLCELYKIPLNSSIAYYICPSVKSHRFLKINVEKNGLANTPVTPSSNKISKIVIGEYKDRTRKCKAPLKKNLLNTNLKKDIKSQISGQDSPFILFSSSEDENFESPYNSLSRASKTRSGQKKTVKKDCKTDNMSTDDSYKFFKTKNTTVNNSSDIWNLCLTDTPKLGKENRKLRSAKTLPKTSQISQKKAKSTNLAVGDTAAKSSKARSKKAMANKSEISSETQMSRLDELLATDDSVSCNVSERKLSIENSRSSPSFLLCDSAILKSSCKSNFNSVFLEDMSSDSVFFSPSKSIQTEKIPNLIDDLCKDLSSLNISKSRSPCVVVGNLEEVIEELFELRLLIQNSMPYPLYSNICKLLAVLLLRKRDGSWNDEKIQESSFLLSEAFSVSLRNIYFSHVIYFKEPEIVKERDIITKTLRSPTDISCQVESLLQLVPEKWTIVQVSSLHNHEYLSTSDKLPCPTKLIFSQYRKNSKPVIVSTDSSSDERFASGFFVEFEKILEESSLTMINKDIKSWWTTRSSLDVRMKNFTKAMENMWLKCWKGIFLGIPQNEERVKQICSTVDAITKVTPCKNVDILKILVDSAHNLSKEQVCTAVCYIWNCSHEEDVHNKLCKPIRNISSALPKSERHPVVLILDQSVQELPWESMPIIKSVPVTRMPSLSILHAKLALMEKQSVLERGFDTSKTYYVLNPGGDLKHSQQYFQRRFEKQIKWHGITGKAPKVTDFISGFKDHELLLYCGHGSGRKYFDGTSVDKLRVQATSVLMGCSSGKLRRLGRVLEANGIVLRLLLSGCPAITANLWDVTDKDIDRFTEKFLQSLIPDYGDRKCNKYSIAKAVSLARSACKMGYLVGSAPVVYGFPVFATTS